MVAMETSEVRPCDVAETETSSKFGIELRGSCESPGDKCTIDGESGLTSSEAYLPDKPEEPLPSDCCGSGCTPCVHDLYQEELMLWQRLRAMCVEERKQFLEQQSAGMKRPVGELALSPVEFRKFKVIGIKQVSGDSFVYTFALPGNQALGIGIGQHAILRERDALGGVVTRQYTPISPSDQRGSFDVLIKNYEEGKMTSIIKEWRPYTETEWKGPFGGLHYIPNRYREMDMLACGTGIAPMVQVIRSVLDNEEDLTVIRLLYSCRTQHGILMKDFLDECSSYWNVRITYVLSRTGPKLVPGDKGSVRYSDRVEFGRIDEQLVKREMPAPSAQVLVLVCGTRSFEKDMIKYLLLLGHDRETIFKF